MARPSTPDPTLVNDIIHWFKRFVVLPSEHHYQVAAIWTIHTWDFSAFDVTPYLLVTSKGPGSGKTRFLDTLATLARNAKRAEDMTPVVMFELIERECPTLLIDEIDAVWSGSRNEPKRQILNTGYKKGGKAWRIRQSNVKEFSTHCPKVLAGINNGMLPATVKDRCIPFELEKRKSGQKVERFKEAAVMADPERETLLDRIWTFVENHHVDIVAMAPEPMTDLSDRQDEISEPLLQVAAVLGCEAYTRKAIQAVFAAASAGTAPSPEQNILQRIQEAFAGSQSIHSHKLCEALGPMYTQRTLAIWLERFQIKPKNVRQGGEVRKGYTADQFMEVWTRYLAPAPQAESPEERMAA